MAFEFHKNKARYFEIQHLTTKEYIIPFLSGNMELKTDMKVLEIGCGEAGVLKAFLERGAQCLGIELSESRVRIAAEYMKEYVNTGQLKLISRDIYDINPDKDLEHKFDLIILKDVIEHIYDQEKFIPLLKSFLNPGGQVFFSFPPWYMPFGGHQQTSKNRFLSKIPYYHLLPKFIYLNILRLGGDTTEKIKDFDDIKNTAISIERFERIIAKSGFNISNRTFYLFNPIYKYKFGLSPRKQYALISAIPFVRNFFTTAMYYLVR